ncbi:MAG TPA: hypothetical protein VG105_13840 [Paraburkholderia sp.]|jgi:hypothetical protein|nr:hypothetical protein [Paraburkholderia sp.]
MNETESGTSKAGPSGDAGGARRSSGSFRTLWVIVLVLPATIAALAIALGVFGLVVRLLVH